MPEILDDARYIKDSPSSKYLKLPNMTDKKKLNFINDNTIYIHSNFDDSISEDVLPGFDKLIEAEKSKREGKIIIDIASNGGIAYYLQAMLARIEKAKKENIIIETRVLSHAYSCGSMLACSGTLNHRFISEYAEHLCHLGSTGTGRVYSDIELERMGDRSRAHFDFVRNIYKKYAKIPDLKKVISNDCLFVRGEQIIDWELADKFY